MAKILMVDLFTTGGHIQDHTLHTHTHMELANAGWNQSNLRVWVLLITSLADPQPLVRPNRHQLLAGCLFVAWRLILSFSIKHLQSQAFHELQLSIPALFTLQSFAKRAQANRVFSSFPIFSHSNTSYFDCLFRSDRQTHQCHAHKQPQEAKENQSQKFLALRHILRSPV